MLENKVATLPKKKHGNIPLWKSQISGLVSLDFIWNLFFEIWLLHNYG
jgi:hypothetical protein